MIEEVIVPATSFLYRASIITALSAFRTLISSKSPFFNFFNTAWFGELRVVDCDSVAQSSVGSFTQVPPPDPDISFPPLDFSTLQVLRVYTSTSLGECQPIFAHQRCAANHRTRNKANSLRPSVSA